MKNILSVYSLIFTLFLMLGCSSNDEKENKIELSRLEVSSGNGISLLTIESSQSWSIEIPKEATWFKIDKSKLEGSGSEVIPVIYDKNNTAEVRVVTIVVSFGENRLDATLTQKAGEASGADKDSDKDEKPSTPTQPTQGGNAPYSSLMEMPSFNAKYVDAVNERHTYGYKAFRSEVNDNQMIITHTTKESDRVKRNYTMLYDKKMYTALWLAYPLHGTVYKDNNAGRSDAWAPDPAVASEYQVDLHKSYGVSYNGDIYSRGHQLASSDRQDSRAANKQTFYYSNMTPQLQRLNGGVWNQLERAAQSWGQSTLGNDTLYVVTGPIYGSSPKTLRAKDGKTVPIPSSYYKVFMKCKFNDNHEVIDCQGIGFLMPHIGYKRNYEDMSYSIDYIERETNFDFFANVPKELQDQAEGNEALSNFKSFR